MVSLGRSSKSSRSKYQCCNGSFGGTAMISRCFLGVLRVSNAVVKCDGPQRKSIKRRIEHCINLGQYWHRFLSGINATDLLPGKAEESVP